MKLKVLSAAVALGFSALFNFVSADTTMSVFTFSPSGRITSEYRYWFPTQNQIDNLIDAVREISRHEDKTDQDSTSLGHRERQSFLKTIKSLQKKPRDFMYTVHDAPFVNSEWVLYKHLKELIRYADAGDLLSLQGKLISDLWPMHIYHSSKEHYAAIWTPDEAQSFYELSQAAERSAETQHGAADKDEGDFANAF